MNKIETEINRLKELLQKDTAAFDIEMANLLTSSPNNFTLLDDGSFITKEAAQILINKYQSGRNPQDKVCFFFDTALIHLITSIQPQPQRIQAIFGEKPNGETTIIFVGANLGNIAVNPSHVYFNDQVLENIWPEVAMPGGLHPKYPSTILE